MKILFVVSLLLFSCLKEASAGTVAKNQPKDYHFLSSNGAEIRKESATEYLLTFPNIKTFMAITDRPYSLVKNLPAKDFIEEWENKKAYKDGNPSATLETHEGKRSKTFILTLKDPDYNEASKELAVKAILSKKSADEDLSSIKAPVTLIINYSKTDSAFKP